MIRYHKGWLDLGPLWVWVRCETTDYGSRILLISGGWTRRYAFNFSAENIRDDKYWED